MFRKRARGLFDLTMATLAIAALATSTPIGELMVRAGRRLLGLGGRDVALVAYLESIGSGAGVDPPQSLPPLPPVGPAPEGSLLLRSFALATLADDPKSEGLALSPEGRAVLLERGARAADLETGPGRLRAVAAALPGLVADLGSEDAALSALVAGLPPVRHALARAFARREDPTLENLLPHLPFSSREPVERIAGRALTLATALSLGWPVAVGTRVTSPFGLRSDPFTGASRRHTGVDLSLPEGAEVVSAAAGVVKRSGEDGLNGKYLVLDHGRGVTSAYCHLSEKLASRGEAVARGQLIARSGNTGRSTGPHLHYQVQVGRSPVDPLGLLAQAGTPLAAAP